MINFKKCAINKFNMEIKIEIQELEFTIQNASNSLYITGERAINSILIQDNKRNNFSLQKWRFVSVNSNNITTDYYISNVDTNLVVGLDPPMKEEGVRLVMVRNDEQISMRWFVNVYENNREEVFFVNTFSGFVMNNFIGETSPGNIQILYGYNGGVEQRYKITRV